MKSFGWASASSMTRAMASSSWMVGKAVGVGGNGSKGGAPSAAPDVAEADTPMADIANTITVTANLRRMFMTAPNRLPYGGALVAVPNSEGCPWAGATVRRIPRTEVVCPQADAGG